MNTAAIATKLNVLESAIVRIEEWANVLFVVAKGVGARFVSKKVGVEKMEIEEDWTSYIPDEEGERTNDLYDRMQELAVDLSHYNGTVPHYKLESLARDIIEERLTFAQAVDRITNKKIITKRG